MAYVAGDPMPKWHIKMEHVKTAGAKVAVASGGFYVWVPKWQVGLLGGGGCIHNSQILNPNVLPNPNLSAKSPIPM
jgi:hypothetical protein